MSRTQPARGMRDFLPADVRKRNYVIGIIKEVYESYGFEPLETPSVENLETLTGKYGEEGNQLIFKILKRGEKLQEELSEGRIKSENELSDLALRYDLTVPLARVVAQHRNDLPKFFKRYQIQPVWRADRPARGRYREFYQCDVDAIGSSSMIVEAELCAAVCKILERLGFSDFVINVNHRKILSGMLELAKIPIEQHSDALVALDKMDKIGESGVINELYDRGISKFSVSQFTKVFSDLGNYRDDLLRQNSQIDSYEIKKLVLQKLSRFISNASGSGGIKDLTNFLEFSKANDFVSKIDFNLTLARGLSYYTGAIFEINVPDLAGSLGGGGRYDGLIGMFGKEQIPACGFSLGLERLLIVMNEREMFPSSLQQSPADVMIAVTPYKSGDEDKNVWAIHSLVLASELRDEGLRVEVFPTRNTKLGNQFGYASKRAIPFVCVLGETELAENKVTLKNLKTGEQETITIEEVKKRIERK